MSDYTLHSIAGSIDTVKRVIDNLLPFQESSLPSILLGLRFPLLKGKTLVKIMDLKSLEKNKLDILEKWKFYYAEKVINRKRGKPFHGMVHYLALINDYDTVNAQYLIDSVRQAMTVTPSNLSRGILVITPKHAAILLHPVGFNSNIINVQAKEFKSLFLGIGVASQVAVNCKKSTTPP